VHTRILGQGLRVSVIGLGAMGMSQSYGPNPGDRTRSRFSVDAVPLPCSMVRSVSRLMLCVRFGFVPAAGCSCSSKRNRTLASSDGGLSQSHNIQ
jgi:hypothetical protein